MRHCWISQKGDLKPRRIEGAAKTYDSFIKQGKGLIRIAFSKGFLLGVIASKQCG